MRLTVFASGSSGNCAFVEEGDTCVLVDAGISARRIRAALRSLGRDFADLSAVLITHEHSDHIRGLETLAKKCEAPVLTSPVTASRLRLFVPAAADRIRAVPVGEETDIGALTVRSFPTPHDVPESVGYVLTGERSFGFCTDAGCVTEEMRAALQGCAGVLIEANHDVGMLREGPYPYYLKKRILSERGHLSNAACAGLACELARRGTGTIVLGHLSRENNTPRTAREAVREALEREGHDVRLLVAPAEGELSVEV